MQTAVGRLPIVEHFFSLQGEGAHQGRSAYFIRTAGCDIGCHWCDTKESWTEQGYPSLPVDQLAQAARRSGAAMAVVTGGEPLQHDLSDLSAALRKEGLSTHIETSGAYPLTGEWDWICVSPKKFRPPLDEVLQQADELKVVVFHPSDFSWAEQNRKKVPRKSRLFLQPEWSKRSKITPLVVDYIKRCPVWRASLQTHKIMGVP